DRLRGDENDNVIDGGAGHDHIRGGDGDDTLMGGEGRDHMVGGAGDDEMHGGGGADFLRGRMGDDTLMGGDGADKLMGGRGDDTLDGGAGKDWLKGEWGDDELFGGEGDDRLHGGRGDDLLVGNGGVDLLKDRRGENVFHQDDPPAPEPTVDPFEGYLVEGDSNDTMQTTDAYTLLPDSPLKLAGQVSGTDVDYVMLTVEEGGTLSVDARTDSGEPVTVSLVVGSGFVMQSFSSDEPSAVQGLPVFPGTVFFLKIEAAADTTYFIDILLASA
ncbi:MAG: calcium-binding protein, partial [Planctomycetota bacterium]